LVHKFHCFGETSCLQLQDRDAMWKEMVPHTVYDMLLGTTELGTACPGDPKYSHCLQVGRPAKVKLAC